MSIFIVYVRVVGGLGHVDVVVGMDRLLATKLTAQEFDGTVGDDFVDVHATNNQHCCCDSWYPRLVPNLLGLSTGTSLPDNERKVLQQNAVDDLNKQPPFMSYTHDYTTL